MNGTDKKLSAIENPYESSPHDTLRNQLTKGCAISRHKYKIRYIQCPRPTRTFFRSEMIWLNHPHINLIITVWWPFNSRH